MLLENAKNIPNKWHLTNQHGKYWMNAILFHNKNNNNNIREYIHMTIDCEISNVDPHERPQTLDAPPSIRISRNNNDNKRMYSSKILLFGLFPWYLKRMRPEATKKKIQENMKKKKQTLIIIIFVVNWPCFQLPTANDNGNACRIAHVLTQLILIHIYLFIF